MKLPRKKLHILLVEDSPSDIRLIQRSLQKSKLEYSLSCVEDGEQAIAYLKKQEEYIQAVRPDIIILDLNLPKLDGREVLAEIKNDLVLKNIPVVVLTTSSSEQDIRRSYDLHANCYVIKPFDVHDFMRIINLVEQFWLKTVALPEL